MPIPLDASRKSQENFRQETRNNVVNETKSSSGFPFFLSLRSAPECRNESRDPMSEGNYLLFEINVRR